MEQEKEWNERIGETICTWKRERERVGKESGKI